MSESRTISRFLGAILIALGGLFAVAAGGCTLVFVGVGVIGEASPRETLSILPLALLFGAPPFAIGVGLFLLGLRLFRGPKPPPKAAVDRFD